MEAATSKLKTATDEHEKTNTVYTAAKAAYDKAESVWKALQGGVDYIITRGAGSTVYKDESNDLLVVSNGNFPEFTGLYIDGELVDAKNYDAVSGSTEVTLHADYLHTLENGAHKIRFTYEDGDDAEATFYVADTRPVEPAKPEEGKSGSDEAGTTSGTAEAKVTAKSTSPQTGVDTDIMGYVLACGIASFSVMYLIDKRRKAGTR